MTSSVKANGDLAHISWSTEAKAWTIASQNVTLLARNEKDVLNKYPTESRYFISHRIALCWMAYLKRLEKLDYSLVHELKQELSDKVFVGEYIGHKDLVKTIKYPRETILFHSVVLKSKDPSVSLQNAYCMANSQAILNKYLLDLIPESDCGVFSDYDSMCDKLVELYQEATTSPLHTTEEGLVFKLILKGSENTLDQVISMCQVKSFEYMTLKTLCEVLTNAISNDSVRERDIENKFSQFIRKLKSFAKGIILDKLPHPFEFYCDLFSTAFSLITKKNVKDKEMYRDLVFND